MKYIFLVYTIFNIGGAELYLRNKKRYVKSIGYEPIIIYCYNKGDIIISDFGNDCYYVSDILYPPCCFSTKKQRQIIYSLLDVINGDQSAIIETHWPKISLWGEMLAEKLQCKHLLYCLEERYTKFTPMMYKYLDFKFFRGELAGINDKTIQFLFGNHRKIENGDKYILLPYEGENVEDIISPLNGIVDKNIDIRIGCIGRLEKPYVIETIRSIAEYCNNHPTQKLQLILIGGTKEQYIISLIENTKLSVCNLDIVVTGYVYPIPLSLLYDMSFIIGGSGAVWSPARHKILTVSMDVNGKPIGVLGITTQNCQHRDENDKDSDDLHYYIESIVKGKYKSSDICLQFPTYKQPEEVFKFHMTYINNSVQNKLYYDVKKILYKNIFIYYVLFGVNNYNKYKHIKRIIKKKLQTSLH